MAAMNVTEDKQIGVVNAAESVENTPKRTMDIGEIMSILPHRYPFLLIDRIIEIEPRKRIVAIKNVTANEPHFTGHFPNYPIMPGVLMIEAMAQAGGALLMTEIPDRDQRLMVFTGIENAKFRNPVIPGDQLRIDVSVLNWRRYAVKMRGLATVEGKVACEATVMCMVIPRPAKETAQVEVEPAKEQTEKGQKSEPQTTAEQTDLPVPEVVLV